MATWEKIAERAKKAYKDLKEEFEEYKSQSIKWSVEDFYELESKYKITNKNAKVALEDMIKNHDAEYGINWGDVEYYKSIYGTLKSKKK